MHESDAAATERCLSSAGANVHMTPAEIDLIWQTSPPRMTLPGPAS